MPLRAGATLGPYVIEAAIGAGGMGEVYRATDTNLGRKVAIKVLPEAVASDPERLARFDREAKTLAALNHPNIAAIYGLERADGQTALVMELVEGPTLADRIAHGPIPVDEALPIAKQIADALEAAHEQGIVHRDLKPANIKGRPDGTVKVLDFGLAKAMEPNSTASSSASMSPTITTPAMTAAGMILGTAAYMSPEQARGKPVDKGSDIWAFGCVLYEMLSGKRPFLGEDVPEVLAGIIGNEPVFEALPSDSDPRLRNLVHRCLTKDRKNRLRDIGEGRFQIQEILAGRPATTESGRRGASLLAWRATVLVIILVAGFIAGTMIRTQLPTLPMVARFPLALSGGAGFGGDITRHLIALSPDGTRLVYVANGQLNLREMDQLNEVPIRGTDAGLSPFFSPDGQWVGFWANGSLKKVAVTGGAPVVLCNLDVPPYGVSWGANDTIVVGQGAGGILRVSSNGGPPEIIIPMEPERNERGHGPQILPDGNTVLFTVTTTASWDEAQIVVESLETGERKLLIAGGTDARYVSTGHIVYALGNTLLAVPFDLRRLEVLGGPVPVIESVRRTLGSPTGAVQAAFSDSGSLAYVSGGDPELGLVWVDRQGAETPLSGPPLSYRFPRLSPDGTRLAVIGNGDVWIHDIVRGTWTRLTFTENNDNLVWTADGERVVFSSSRAGAQNLFWKSVDGSDEATQLTEGESAKHPDSLSPDGRHLAFHEHSSANGTDLWILSLEGDFEARPFLRTPYNERVATFSPNGRWLAYVSDSSGVNEIYAQPFPGPGGTNVVSPNGGLSPVWHRTGRELFYRMSSEMMVVDIATESGFVAGTPRPLFRKDRDSSGPQVHYDVTPSGERFVMSLPEQEARAAEIVVVLNWLEELKRLVPVD